MQLSELTAEFENSLKSSESYMDGAINSYRKQCELMCGIVNSFEDEEQDIDKLYNDSRNNFQNAIKIGYDMLINTLKKAVADILVYAKEEGDSYNLENCFNLMNNALKNDPDNNLLDLKSRVKNSKTIVLKYNEYLNDYLNLSLKILTEKYRCWDDLDNKTEQAHMLYKKRVEFIINTYNESGKERPNREVIPYIIEDAAHVSERLAGVMETCIVTLKKLKESAITLEDSKKIMFLFLVGIDIVRTSQQLYTMIACEPFFIIKTMNLKP